MTIIKIDSRKLADFIVEGKKKGYAGGGEEKIINGKKVLLYRNGLWLYRDEYDGFFGAPGCETVYYHDDETPVWQMSYSGGMAYDLIPKDRDDKDTRERKKAYAEEIFNFLKEVLGHVTVDAPYRGPRFFPRGVKICYYNDMRAGSNLILVSGKERIIDHRRNTRLSPVFSQEYIGQLIIRKNDVLKRKSKNHFILLKNAA